MADPITTLYVLVDTQNRTLLTLDGQTVRPVELQYTAPGPRRDRLADAPDTRIEDQITRMLQPVTIGNGDYITGLTHGQQQHVQVHGVQVLSSSPPRRSGRLTASKVMVHVLSDCTDEGNRGTLGWPARDAL